MKAARLAKRRQSKEGTKPSTATFIFIFLVGAVCMRLFFSFNAFCGDVDKKEEGLLLPTSFKDERAATNNSVKFKVAGIKTTTSLEMGHARHVEQSNRSAYTSCLEETLSNLPIGQGRPKLKRKNQYDANQVLVWAHHYDARNPKQWNANIRFDPLPELQQNQYNNKICSVWEVGAHILADDTKEFLRKYPHCDYHAYEPIPTYAQQLSKVWESTSNVHTHHYGIRGQQGSFHVPKEMLAGQATYIGDTTSSPPQQQSNETTTERAMIVSFEQAIHDANGTKPTVLHLNCEGCEWALLPEGVASGFIHDIPVLQIGFHNYGNVGLGQRAIEYCHIREQLSTTHRLVDGAVPFAWERWVLKT